jgi:cellobiose-specific phosphotransferase system component IIC
MLRRIVAFVVAAAVMVVLGSAAHSFFVQAAWSMAAGQAAGIPPAPIPLADRISWAVHDLFGMILPYGTVTSIALLIAFLAAGALTRVSGHRVIVFGVASAAAIFVLFTAVKMSLGTVGIFGARGAMGLAAQMAVGLFAGVLFAKLAPRSKPWR